jgi:hypothetical protein
VTDQPKEHDVVRAARLDSLSVLLTRIANGRTLTPEEARLLVKHVGVEVSESTTARAVGAELAALTQRLDIGDAQAWCKYCRRAWDSPAHRCESDAEQRVQRIAELRDRWLMAGPPPLGTPLARWWDKRLAELNAALDEPAPATPTATQATDQPK